MEICRANSHFKEPADYADLFTYTHKYTPTHKHTHKHIHTIKELSNPKYQKFKTEKAATQEL